MSVGCPDCSRHRRRAERYRRKLYARYNPAAYLQAKATNTIHLLAALTLGLYFLGRYISGVNVPFIPFISDECARTGPGIVQADWAPDRDRLRIQPIAVETVARIPADLKASITQTWRFASRAYLASYRGQPTDVQTIAAGLVGVSPAPALPGAGTLTAGQVAQVASAAGFPTGEIPTAVAVARAESGWQPAVRSKPNRNGTYDHGLWQINSVHAQLLASGDWRDPATNARMAYAVWQRAGRSWSPWTTYTTGAYLRFMSQPAAPVMTAAYTTGPAAGCEPAPSMIPAGMPASFPPSGSPAESGLSPNALRVLRGVDAAFGPHGYGGVGSRPNNPSSDHPRGRAVDVMISGWKTPAGNAEGWRIARWAQANAERLGISYVIFDRRWWQIGDAGWSAYSHPSGATDATNAHRDHVHVSVSG